MKLPTRILWAVDAFTEDKALHAKTAKTIAAWTKGQDTAVEPVFVMSPDQLFVPSELFGTMHDDLKKNARARLEALLGRQKFRGLLEPTVLVSASVSLRSAIQTLLGYARQTGAELIVCSTQSKKGATRFFFGSFAETLVLQSEIPVFLVSPKTKAVPGFKRVLFATDLTQKSREALIGVARLAAQHKARLFLYHKLEYVTEYSLAALQNTPLYAGYMKDDVARRQQRLDELATLARQEGAQVNVVLDRTTKPMNDAILSAVRKTKAQLVALASQTGPVTSVLLGSITRRIIRTAPSPVWVVHSLALLAFLYSLTAGGAEPKKWQEKMTSMGKLMGDLLPELASRKGNAKKIEKDAKALSEIAHSIKDGGKMFPPPPDADPTLALIAGKFDSQVKHAYKAIQRGQLEYGKSVLRTATGYCIACHTRNDKGPDFPTFPLDPKIKNLDHAERGELFTATRQFDKALAEFQSALSENRLSEGEQISWMRTVQHALAVAVRAKKDPDAAMAITTAVIAEPAAPEYMKENARRWRDAIAAWKAEPPRKANTEEGLYLEMKRLLGEAQKAQAYPVDRSGDILYLRAAAIAHELLSAAPSGPHTAEAFLIAGLSTEVLGDPTLWPIHELYYENCVRRAPRSPVGAECFRRYEEAVYVGWSGSAGTLIPDDVKAKLAELKALSGVK